MNLPPDFDSRAAFLRISRGLVNAVYSEKRADWAARTALAEAPFEAPSELTWQRACRRARVLASNGSVEKPDGKGNLGYPADGIGRAA